MNIFNNWYNFLLSIFFWIFIWRLFDIILDEIKFNNSHKIIFYSMASVIIFILISKDRYFFK